MWVKPLVVAFALVGGASLSQAAVPCPAPAADAPVIRLAGVDGAGDLVLEDGRTVRLVGLAPRQDAAEAARFNEAALGWRGRDLTLVVLAQPDRWGRLPARLLSVPDPDRSDAKPEDLAAALLLAKAALRLADAAHPGCDLVLRVATSEPAGLVAPARPSRPASGSVNTPAASGDAIDGLDVAALKAQAGRIVAMEGRIVSVGERAQRTYLNLSRKRGEGGAVMLTRKLWREMQDAGWTAASLTGRRVRARGLLGGQDGLLLDAGSLSALDVID